MRSSNCRNTYSLAFFEVLSMSEDDIWFYVIKVTERNKLDVYSLGPHILSGKSIMKRTILGTLLGLSLVTVSAATFADDWKFMPVLDAKYKPDATLSLVGGVLNGTPAGSGSYQGIEVAFNCLALQPPTGIIRSQISLGTFDHNGIKLTTFEINPHWTTSLANNLTFGVGPGVGYVKAEVNGQTTNMAALQIGADLNYRIGTLNLGLGARWQDTSNKDIAPGIHGANNTLIEAKVGINF